MKHISAFALFFAACSHLLVSCASVQDTRSSAMKEHTDTQEKRVKLTPEEDKLRSNYSKLSYSGLLKECSSFANLLEYPSIYQDSDQNGIAYERNLAESSAFENAKALCSERMALVLSSINKFTKSIEEKGIRIERSKSLVNFVESVVAGHQNIEETIVLHKQTYNKQQDYYVTQVENEFTILGNLYYYKDTGDKVLNLPNLFVDTTSTKVTMFVGTKAPYGNVVYLYKGTMKAKTVDGATVNTLRFKLFSNREFIDFLGLDSSSLVTTDVTFYIVNAE